MANVLLAPIYKDVYGEQFSSGNFSDRMKMQKLIYLLQEVMHMLIYMHRDLQ